MRLPIVTLLALSLASQAQAAQVRKCFDIAQSGLAVGTVLTSNTDVGCVRIRASERNEVRVIRHTNAPVGYVGLWANREMTFEINFQSGDNACWLVSPDRVEITYSSSSYDDALVTLRTHRLGAYRYGALHPNIVDRIYTVTIGDTARAGNRPDMVDIGGDNASSYTISKVCWIDSWPN